MGREWNDTGVPLGYLITFRCYGTWLHGDERGSVDRQHNRYGTPFLQSNPALNRYLQNSLKRDPVELDGRRRLAVETAVRETCEKRNWGLMAVSVRTNHVHVVVDAGGESPNKVLSALKANATRTMRERSVWDHESSPWADKGSTRWLWNDRDIEIAVDYVVIGQGDELPKFD